MACCFLPHKTLTDGLESCRLLVDVFISCSNSHMTAPIHNRESTSEQVV